MRTNRVIVEITFNPASTVVHLRKTDRDGTMVQFISSKKNRLSRWEEAALLTRLRTAIDSVLAVDQAELF